MNRRLLWLPVAAIAAGIGLTKLAHKGVHGQTNQTVPGLVNVALSPSTPADTTFKAGYAMLSGNVTSWTMANGFDPYQTFGLLICQPVGAVYTITGAPSNFYGTLLVPTVASTASVPSCATTSMFWLNGTWYVIQVPVQSITGLSPVATSGAYADLSGKPTIPSIVGLATVSALTAETTRATAAEGTNATAISNEVTARANALTSMAATIPAASTMTVGTVTSTTCGTAPTVTNSGTATAAVLNFGIPNCAPLKATTGTITGTLLALGGSDTATVTVPGAVMGQRCSANTTDGTNPSSSVWVHCDVTSASTVTVYETAFGAATPLSKAYNVSVGP